ncbi:MAG: class I SAM-dependent methyltransferase [Rhodospirillales bacterium]
MWINAVSLREFYTTGQGRVARLMIRRGIRTIWPDVTGQSVLGMGYATPYLGMFRDKAERVLSAMPAPQGVLHWPSREGLSLTALTEEVELPFPDLSIDRLLLVHAVEFTEQVRPLMREAWRVLSGSGRLLVVVPNRRGIWARLEHTPFGHGLPYSPSQLSRLLRETLFTPVQSRPALFVPPVSTRVILSSAQAIEGFGQRWFSHFSGIHLIEATKNVYAGSSASESLKRNWTTAGKAVTRPVPGDT